MKNRKNSSITATIPKEHYGIDITLYRPLDIPKESSLLPKILLVGNPYLPFKNFYVVHKALNMVWLNGHKFTVTWACKTNFSIKSIFHIDVKIKVPQQELTDSYRANDIYINSSPHEAFDMLLLKLWLLVVTLLLQKWRNLNLR